MQANLKAEIQRLNCLDGMLYRSTLACMLAKKVPSGQNLWCRSKWVSRFASADRHPNRTFSWPRINLAQRRESNPRKNA